MPSNHCSAPCLVYNMRVTVLAAFVVLRGYAILFENPRPKHHQRIRMYFHPTARLRSHERGTSSAFSTRLTCTRSRSIDDVRCRSFDFVSARSPKTPSARAVVAYHERTRTSQDIILGSNQKRLVFSIQHNDDSTHPAP